MRGFRFARRGFSLIELLIALSIIAILVAIAIPGAQRVLDNGSEVAVERELQTIHQAQILHMTQRGGYAAALEQLGPRGAGLIPRSLASGEKNGYLFTMTLTPGGYTMRAAPKVRAAERRNFYLDEDGVVHQSLGAAATAESPELN